MRACTAALIELRYEETPKSVQPYRGEVEFLSQVNGSNPLCTSAPWHCFGIAGM